MSAAVVALAQVLSGLESTDANVGVVRHQMVRTNPGMTNEQAISAIHRAIEAGDIYLTDRFTLAEREGHRLAAPSLSPRDTDQPNQQEER